MYSIRHCFTLRPSDFTVSEDFNPGLLHLIHGQSDTLTTRLDLIHTRPYLIHKRLDLIHIRVDLIYTKIDFIHYAKILPCLQEYMFDIVVFECGEWMVGLR